MFGVLISVLGYLTLGVYLYLNQRKYVYHPSSQDFYKCSGFSDYEALAYNQTRFYYKHVNDAEVIVYYHGNAGSACDRSSTKTRFESFGKSVIYVEYAGYSNDPQTPSETLILNDVENIQAFIQEKGFSHVSLYGLSLGSGAASYHASIGDVDSLLLVAPFSSLTAVAQAHYPIYPVAWFIKDHFNNLERLQAYQGKLLIIHGDRDRLIPPRLSQELYQVVPTPTKQYVLVKGATHNNIWHTQSYQTAVEQFWR